MASRGLGVESADPAIIQALIGRAPKCHQASTDFGPVGAVEHFVSDSLPCFGQTHPMFAEPRKEVVPLREGGFPVS